MKEETFLSDYVLLDTNNGKLIADFYFVVLESIRTNKEGKQMSFIGIPIKLEQQSLLMSD